LTHTPRLPGRETQSSRGEFNVSLEKRFHPLREASTPGRFGHEEARKVTKIRAVDHAAAEFFRNSFDFFLPSERVISIGHNREP